MLAALNRTAESPAAASFFRLAVRIFTPLLAPFVKSDIVALRRSSVQVHHEIGAVRNVLMVIGTLGPGGAERQLVALANELVCGFSSRPSNESLQIVVVCLRCSAPPDNFYADQLDPRIRVIDLNAQTACDFNGAAPPVEHAIVRRLWFRSSRNHYFRLREVLDEVRPDVIHGWLDRTAILAGIAGLAAGVPRILLSTRNLNPSNFVLNRPYFRPAYRELMRTKSVRVICNSEAGARDYERWLGVKQDSIQTIHNGFDLARLEQVEAESLWEDVEGALVVGSVMRFALEKDPKLWMQSAALIAYKVPAARFVLVGSGPLRHRIERWAEDYGLSERLRILPPTQDVYPLIAGFDVFLLTSRREGLPNVLVEAQMLGIPVVSTDAGGARETFEDGSSGALIRSRRPSEVAEEVVRLLADSSLRLGYSARARIFARANFSVQAMLQGHLDVYQSIGE